MPYYNRKNYNYSRRRNAGYDRAMQHIREGRELSNLLGGTDNTVKQYLFNLPRNQLDVVLKEYGHKHGEAAEMYAKETMPRWRNGTVKMSGMVAERLYRLLPSKMPLRTKFNIAEELWRHVGPSSSKVLRFGRNASYEEIISTAENHISEVVLSYEIPDTLQRRFDWLSTADITVKQQLLNYLRDLDKGLVMEASRLQVRSMLNHLSTEQAKFTHVYEHTVEVGKHRLKLVADNNLDGCVLEDDVPSRYNAKGNTGWIFFLLFVGLVILFLVLANRQ